ncbi:MAG: uridine kinase family protein [Pseudonocardiaceae bacterium]
MIDSLSCLFVERLSQALLNLGEPTVILVCGPSGAGKSDISRKIAQTLDCSIIHLDNFYRSIELVDFELIDGEIMPQWDSPSAVDWPAIEHLLKAFLCKPGYVRLPTYSFAENRPSGSCLLRIRRHDVLIVDGTLAGYTSELCSQLGIATFIIYVDAPNEERMRRTELRDTLYRRQAEPPEVRKNRWKLMTIAERKLVKPQSTSAAIIAENEDDKFTWRNSLPK